MGLLIERSTAVKNPTNSGHTSGAWSKDFAFTGAGGFRRRSWVIAALFFFSPLCLIASKATSVEPKQDPIETALSLMGSDLSRAVQLLESISPKHPHFRLSVQELMKIFYQQQQWDRFFAYAQYHRVRWSHERASKIQLLEALALLRHCQNDLLKGLITELENRDDSSELGFQDDLDQIRILARIDFEKKLTRREVKTPIHDYFKGQRLWKLNSPEVQRMKVSKLRLKVENLCP